jgi:hypothetical protein
MPSEMVVYNFITEKAGYDNCRLRNIVKYIDESGPDINGVWTFDTTYLDVKFLFAFFFQKLLI